MRIRSLLMAASTGLLLGMLPAALPATAAVNTTPLLKSSDDVMLRADKIVYDTDTQVVTAMGRVEVDQDGRILQADRITYNQKTDTLTAEGNLSLMEPDGNVAFANHVVLTNSLRSGILNGFAALIGKNGKLAAVRATRDAGNKTVATRAAFTPCKICREKGEKNPLWEIRAYKVIYDEKRHRIYYHDAVLKVFGVPVLYTPYFSHPDPTIKRKSGILAPDVGNSTLLGTFVQAPFYISLTDSRDLTLAPMYTADAGVMLQAEYRERWNKGGMWLQPSVTYDANSDTTGQKHQYYSSIFGSGRIPITNVWNVGFDVQLTSNDTYLKRYDISSNDRLVSDLFIEGVSGRSRLAITGYYFQGLRTNDDPASTPFVLPLVEYTYIPRGDILGGQFRFDINTSALHRDLGVDSARATAEMRWRLPIITGNGQLITVQANARGDVYRTQNNDPAATDLHGNLIPLNTRYIYRGLPYIAVDWRWPFVSQSPSRKTSFVVEPIAQLIAAPYGGNPDGIPNDDSVNFELDETDIFRFNPLPGYDRVETGPRANVGLRTETFFPTGSVEVLLGQSFRLKPEKVFGPGSGFSGKHSDIVGRLSLKFPPYFSATHRVDIDQSNGKVRRNEVYLDGNYGRTSLQLSYIRLAQQAVTPGLNSREEVSAEGTLGLWEHWAAFAGARRDLERNQMLETEYGLGYEDECVRISLSYRRKFIRDRDVPPSTAVILRFKLKTGLSDDDQSSSDLFPRHIFSTP